MTDNEWKLAKARGEELRWRREAAIAKVIQENIMSNKTPPAWAIQAARDIQSEDVVLDAQIISECAPDAEALAVALESALDTLDQLVKINRIPSNSKGRHDAREAIDEYRARFPKAQETT